MNPIIKFKKFSLFIVLVFLVLLVIGCGSQEPTPVAAVSTPAISEPKVGAPAPQQPGEEVGISVDVSSGSGVALNYTWIADGGEIVRGQGSPAITYRVPDEPGTYNVRVKIEWDGQSVEKVTSIKVEEEATETPESPTDTPEPIADTPTPKPTNTPTPTNTPKSPTATPTPTSTNTPAPTNTPRPTPTPTATIDADPTVYDNFNNPANDGSFNQSQWDIWRWSPPPNQISQRDGMLVITQVGKPEDSTSLAGRKYDRISLSDLTQNVSTS